MKTTKVHVEICCCFIFFEIRCLVLEVGEALTIVSQALIHKNVHLKEGMPVLSSMSALNTYSMLEEKDSSNDSFLTLEN